MLEHIFHYHKLNKKDLSGLSYTPKNNEIIYHYCSGETLWAIMNNRAIWMSSIFEMNDSDEFLWGAQIILEALNSKKNRFPKDFRYFILANAFQFDNYSLPVLCSFSKNGDLLSQWRAYANDAQGFSIGFDAKVVQDLLPVNMKEVSYDEKLQKKLLLNSTQIQPFLEKSEEFIEQGADALFGDTLARFSADIASLKNPHFFEEQEIRIIHLLNRRNKMSDWHDVGGHNINGEVKGLPVLTRERDDQKIVYIALPLIDDRLINEIIISPKNKHSIEDIEESLSSIGFNHVQVRRSRSYLIDEYQK